MSEVNAELASTMAGRRIKSKVPEYAWLACNDEVFINKWLPLFESGRMRPEDAPVVRVMHEVERPEVA